MIKRKINKNIILLLRPLQWIKNLYIFLPLFFNGHLLEWNYVFPTLFVFMSWCMMASAVYCFNDIQDRQYDKLHPRKNKRAIVSGAVSIKQAYVTILCLLLTTFILLIPCRQFLLFIIAGLYILTNILYCIHLKQIAIVDVFIIATGYVFRIWAGGAVSEIRLSHWIVLIVFLLSLFLALAKRRDDIALYQNGIKTRCGIAKYEFSFINQSLSIIASVIMVCYIMYTVSEEIVHRYQSPYLYLTSVFVLAGLLRYLLLTARGKSGSPTCILIKDRFIQICIIVWGIIYYILIYE